VESFADKSFAEGEGIQDTPTVKRVNDWFGASPRLVSSVAGGGVFRLRADTDV